MNLVIEGESVASRGVGWVLVEVRPKEGGREGKKAPRHMCKTSALWGAQQLSNAVHNGRENGDSPHQSL